MSLLAGVRNTIDYKICMTLLVISALILKSGSTRYCTTSSRIIESFESETQNCIHECLTALSALPGVPPRISRENEKQVNFLKTHYLIPTKVLGYWWRWNHLLNGGWPSVETNYVQLHGFDAIQRGK